MPSVNMVWNGSCTERPVVYALSEKLLDLAQVASVDPIEGVEMYDRHVCGRILVGRSALASHLPLDGLEPLQQPPGVAQVGEGRDARAGAAGLG